MVIDEPFKSGEDPVDSLMEEEVDVFVLAEELEMDDVFSNANICLIRLMPPLTTTALSA